MEEVFIVGGGPSLQEFDWEFLRGKDVIAVNAAVFDVPNLTHFITMDHSFFRKIQSSQKTQSSQKIFQTASCTKVFVCGMHHVYLQESCGAIVDTRFGITYNLEDFDLIVKSRHSEGIGLTFGDFCSGNNSGFCALQLAVLLGYTNIRLLGFDLTINGNKFHYHEMYFPSKRFPVILNSYYNLFVKGLIELRKKRPDISVVSCSPISRLNGVINFADIKDL